MSKQFRTKMKRAIAGILMITTIVWLSGVMALVPVANAATIVDGDVIKNPSAAGLAQFDVYIVKLVGTKKFKRLVLNPQVFASYGHLKWSNVKSVTQAEMDSFKTSALVRVDGDAAQKVYALAPDNDTGAKSWVNVTATQFVTDAGADADSIYTINSTDAGNYSAVTDITTVAQVTTFLTAGTLPSTTPVVTTGNVTVGVAADNPAGGTIADGSAYNTMLKLTFTNGTSSEVNVTGITATRTGFATDSNITGVLVKDSAGNRHGNVLTLADTKAALSFASDPIKVGAGKTETVSVQANISSTAGDSGSVTIGFKVGAAADITSSAAVTGTFPLAGANFSVVNGANSLGAVTVQSQTISTAQQSTDLGVTAKDIGKFKFSETTSKEAVNINKIRFYNNGNSADADLANIQLYNTNEGTVLATVASTTSKYVTFNLSASPLKLAKGTNRTLSVRADVVNGSTRTAQFTIQNDYDVEVTGADTGSGILVTEVSNSDDGTNTTFPSGETTNFNTILIAAGTLTVSKDASSPSGNIGQGTSNITLGAWKLEAKGEDIQLQKATLDLSTGTTTSADFTSTVKLQTAEGTTIYSVAASDTNLFGTAAQTTLATYYTIKAGTTAILKIVADTASDATNGETVQAKFGNVYYYKASSNTYATAQATTLAANTLTINTAALTVAKNTAMGNSTVVAGQSGLKIGSYVLQAGSAEGVNVSTVNITLNTIDSSRLSNLKLFKGSTQIGSTVASPAASANAFSVGGSLTISASASEAIDVYADIQTGSTATFTTSIAASGISANGTPSGTTITTVPASDVTGQSITAQASGTLTLSTDTATPVQAILHADQTGVEVARFKLAATVEAIKVTKVILESTNGSGNAQSVALWDGTLQVGSTVNLVDGKATFSGLSLVVAKDSSKTLKATLGTTASGTMISAQQIKLTLATIEAVGNSSGTTVYPKSIYTTYGTSANETLTANTASQAWTVASTAGLSVGDVVFVTLQAGTTNGTGFYVVDAVTDATTLALRGDTANGSTANLDSDGSSTGTVTRIATSTTTTISTASAETITADTASQALTVASTTGFEPGDVLFVSEAAGTTAGSGFYVVDSVTNATTLAISGRTLNAAGNIVGDGGVTGKVTKLVTGATTTVSTTSSQTVTANVASALDVASTAGFTAGDVVFVELLSGTTNGSGFYVVNAVTDSDTLSVKGNTLGGSGNLVADGAVTGKVTKLGTTAGTTITTASAQTITANTASQALDVTSTSGFVAGDLVFVVSSGAGTAGTGFYAVNTVTDTDTLAIVGQTIAGGNIVTADGGTGRVSLITSSTGAGNPFYLHDVEPAISLASGSPSGTSSGNSSQVVAKFAIKADGSRDLTVKSFTLTRGGNIGTRVATTAYPYLYLGGTSTLLGSGDSWSSAAAGATDLVTLTTPYTITAGDTVAFDIKVDTSSAQANDTFQVYLDGTAGSFGNLNWYYDAAAPSPGTEPTNSSPSTVSDSYPVYGGTLSY